MSSPSSLPPTDPRSASKASSRASSTYRDAGGHAPLTPSRLWQSHGPGSSPEDHTSTRSQDFSESSSDEPGYSPRTHPVSFEADGIYPLLPHRALSVEDLADTQVEGALEEPPVEEVDENTRLLESYNRGPGCGTDPCTHGTFSPRPASPSSLASVDPKYKFGERHNISTAQSYERGSSSVSRGYPYNGLLSVDGLLGRGNNTKKLSTTQLLARRAGVKSTRMMYLSYYIPITNWASQYKWSYLKGDLIAALTMASFYIPMALSYASNLGHIPPINGLYSFVFNPLIYAFLGTCPQMVVGPEAAGSLLVGSVVRTSVDIGHSGDEDAEMHARIAGVVTGMAGAVIFIAGLTRLGFLDSVLSRPFLRGFISAIGFVILVDQLIPEMGLSEEAKRTGGVSHGSSVDKIVFLVEHIGSAHGLTSAVSFASFAIIMVCRTLKRRLQPRFPSVAYIPDRFIVVALSAVFAWAFRWDEKGLEILGDVKSSTGSPFPFHWPFVPSYMKHVREAMSTSFLIALLGFFESSVAAKALGGGEGRTGEGLQGMTLSANRELIALGVANLVGGCFMALPAFGGYGRSKVNASTGGRTPMSSIFLSLITIICVLFLLPYFYFLPKGVLSAMVSVVAYSLIEECPHDIKFFIKIRGASELALMFLIFGATIFYSLPLGVALGMGLSILSLIRHATKPRIQILGKVPGTSVFENAEDNPRSLEFIEGCLIIKIPEPLTFANTGDLKNRLSRLEATGSTNAHPALPRIRPVEHNKNIIFDVHGVTALDGSGTQVLMEIVEGYIDRGVRVFFCRVPARGTPIYTLFEQSGIVETCGGPDHFVGSVEEALKMTELDNADNWYTDHPNEQEA
ncbi:hypothetical protein MMC15_004465 [Xylographa vitiligo]|nr:hypothetical protein [Xylographa vitiligo]